jgi:hypothetical protein
LGGSSFILDFDYVFVLQRAGSTKILGWTVVAMVMPKGAGQKPDVLELSSLSLLKSDL